MCKVLSLSYRCITMLLFCHRQTGPMPGAFASLAALGTGARLEQVLRSGSPLSTTATLVRNMKTVKARGPAARQWLWVLLSRLGKTTGWLLLVPSCEVGCGLAPCPRHPPHPSATSCCHKLLLAGPQNLRPLGENSSQASGMSSHAPQARVPALPLSSVRCRPWGHTPCLQPLMDLEPVTSSQASLHSSVE